MSTSKHSAYMTQVTPSLVVPGTNGSILAFLLRPLQWLAGWQVRRQKGKSDPTLAVDLEFEQERSVKDGKPLGSAQEAARERAIDVQRVMLRMTGNR